MDCGSCSVHFVLIFQGDCAKAMLVQFQCILPSHGQEVCHISCCAVVIIATNLQLYDASVCCEVSVGLEQRCEWC